MARFENLNVNKLNTVTGTSNPTTGRVPFVITGSNISNITAATGVALTIPAGTYVYNVWLRATTSAGAAATTSVGDSTTAASWLTGVNTNTVNSYVNTAGNYYVGGKHYTAQTNLTYNTTVDGGGGVGVFYVQALCSKA